MLIYASTYIRPTPSCFSCLPLTMTKPILRNIMHIYANLCIVIHAIDTILFKCLPLTMTKAHVKFHLDPASSF